MKISTSPVAAKEDAITDAMITYQKLFDESENQPQFSPKEIAAIYPDLNRNANAQALRRVANASGTPRGKHLAKVVARIDKMRSNEAYGSWKEFESVFPTASLEDRKHYFIDILTLWCLPSSADYVTTAATMLKEDANSPLEEELFEYAENGELTEEKLEEVHEAATDRLRLIMDKFGKAEDLPAWADQEKDDIDSLNSCIEQIITVWDKRYYELWDELKREYYMPSLSDRADRIIELMRAFYKA